MVIGNMSDLEHLREVPGSSVGEYVCFFCDFFLYRPHKGTGGNSILCIETIALDATNVEMAF